MVAINFTDQRMWEAEALKLGPFRRLRLSSLTWKKTSWALFKRVKESIHVRKLPSQALLLKRRTDTIFMLYHLFRPTHHGVWKFLEKVSFNLASEASYFYILSETPLKVPKNSPFWWVFEKWMFRSNSVLPDSLLIWQNSMENAIIHIYATF